MRIGVLTSSRADFGIYLPLLKAIKKDPYFSIDIIAFGTHLSAFYGNTINQIEAHGFEVKYKIESMLSTDSAESISTSMGLTQIKFSSFWGSTHQNFDLIFCLGDRFEMFSAVMAAIPFNLKFAHLHGGETTLGAIDNVFRHAITLASKYHFTSTECHALRVKELLNHQDGIYNVGALSLDNLNTLNLLDVESFNKKWNINLKTPTILITFHPETVDAHKNNLFADELVNALESLTNYQLLITMPNADTAGNIIRTKLIDKFSEDSRVFLIENLGSQSYFTAMKYCSFLLGNTSSGIIEAASFGKYVINLGDRQKGRTAGENVIQCAINSSQILEKVSAIESMPNLKNENIYYNGGATEKIIATLKSI